MDNRLDQVSRLIEAERSQIGHEIHDALLPLIFASSASVTRMLGDSPETLSDDSRQRLEQLSTWLDDAMQTGRRLLTQVYPPELIGTVWTRAAVDAIKRLFPDTKTQIDWQLERAVDDTSPVIALAAYRIVVEAVRNAIRHGKAAQVSIIGERPSDGFRIVIHDDGNGFDPAQIPADRFGVRAMIDRAELVGGKITIDSKIGGPTTVTFVIVL